MRAQYNAAATIDAILNPHNSQWQAIKSSVVALESTPIAMQPTPAIRESWSTKTAGNIGNVSVQAVVNQDLLAIRLQWNAPNQMVDHGDNTVFPDSAAIAFPLAENAPVVMGAPDMPVSMWFWRANENGEARQIEAAGIGTSETRNRNLVKSHGAWKDGKWSVVMARALQVPNESQSPQFKLGSTAQIALAVWDGGNTERGGIKAYSGMQWLELILTEGNS